MKRHLPKIGRDTVLFVCGLAGVFHETVVAQAERPSLLFVFAAMIGLPVFLRADEKKAERNGKSLNSNDGASN